jgi:hypothetical protein
LSQLISVYIEKNDLDMRVSCFFYFSTNFKYID